MKPYFAIFYLLIAFPLYAIQTNGVFYVDNDVGCVVIAQNGGSTTNKLESGRTYQTGNSVLELKTTSATAFFMSGGPLIQVGSNADFSILLYDVDVENLMANPQRAKYGNHMINLGLTKGEFSIIYPNKNTNSRVFVNTHYADYELSGGKYYFRLTGKSALVYVLEGGMTVHGDKNRVDVVDKGNFAIAVPFGDSDSGIDDKMVTSFKKAKNEDVERFASPLLTAEKKWADVGFFVISGRVIGVQLK